MKKFDRTEFLKLIKEMRYEEAEEYDLTGADLTGADLTDANLRGADLTGANLDFSCWPLWCGSLGVKVDKRIACQLAYHLCALICDDAEYIAARNSILSFANQFHLVGDCGELVEV